MSSAPPFRTITDDDLALARADPRFRRELLGRNLRMLLGTLQKRHEAVPVAGSGARQMQEAVALAVRLAELITAPPPRRRHPTPRDRT